MSCPDHATNWNGTAFSPVTRLYYVMAIEKCSVKLSPGSWKTERPRAGAWDEVSPSARYRDREDRLGDSAGRTDRRQESGGHPGNRRRHSVLWRPERLLHCGRRAGRENVMARSAERDHQNVADDLYGEWGAVRGSCRRLQHHVLRDHTLGRARGYWRTGSCTDEACCPDL